MIDRLSRKLWGAAMPLLTALAVLFERLGYQRRAREQAEADAKLEEDIHEIARRNTGRDGASDRLRDGTF